MHYQILKDKQKFNQFANILPNLEEGEVFYLSLFARNKYCPALKDDGQLVRFIAKKEDIEEKILRLESTIGSYIRDEEAIPQESLSLYIAVNPRSLIKANKKLLVEMAERAADGNMDFNPISLATTCIHRATTRKIYVDFDYDCEDWAAGHLQELDTIIPNNNYHAIRTNGGYHVLVKPEELKGIKDWYVKLANLPYCDVKGSANLTPVAGCVQGNFVPYLVN